MFASAKSLSLEHDECKKLVYCSSTGAIPEKPKGWRSKKLISVTRNWYKGVIVSQRQWRRRLFWIAVKSDGLNACVVHPRGILGPDDFAIGETTGVLIQIINGEMPAGIAGSFNLCDVRDLAQGTIFAADKGKS